ncbi:MAG: ABC transporter ATP-binding protein [Anaerolineae bacterium]|nr:ABC transporter ATP-binding protein [Phycisphaerae bacterium]
MISALFVGLVFSSGLGAMLPILRVLVNEDTLKGWMDRSLVETKIGVHLADNNLGQIIRVVPNGPADRAGVGVNERVNDLTRAAYADEVEVGDRSIPARAVPWYQLRAQQVANLFPTDRQWGAVKTIAIIFIALLLIGIVGNVVRFFQEYLSDKASILATNDIRRHLYDHVMRIPLTFFGLSGTSDVTSRLVQDSQVLQAGFKSILGQSVQEPIKAAFAFALAVWIDWRLTIFIIIFAPIMAVTIKKFGKKMRRASRAALQQSSTMLGQIEGTLTGIRVVKAASAERFERRRYAKIMDLLKVDQLKMARYEALATPAMEQITLLLAGVVLLFAAYLLFVTKTLDQSGFLVFLACMAAIAESLRRVSKLNAVLARSNAAAARIFEVLDMPAERSRDARVKLPPIQREVRFENVTFGYANSPAPAVIDVNLVAPRGKSLAIVGRNGSGKTTLLALLPRFYDPQQGRVLIDGVDIRDATLRSLRNQIAIVTQDPVIFPGTIAENIAYGHPAASRLSEKNSEDARALRSKIEDAAKRAFCDDFIRAKPQGYDTPLDGLGAQLSGGQRQRLNIARAILRDAPILILDEATSQVDAESEHLIQQAIEQIMHERTTFVIAHRFSTIKSADTIVVMDAGRIVGQGKHEELIKTCETYAQLYERQLFDATADPVEVA